MLHDRIGRPPPEWRVSTAYGDAVRFIDETGTLVLEAVRTGSDRWHLICRTTRGEIEVVDEFGTIRSEEAALDALESAAWIVHRNGIDPEHVGVSLEREGSAVRWRSWKFE
jgi:hypothetical protein